MERLPLIIIWLICAMLPGSVQSEIPIGSSQMALAQNRIDTYINELMVKEQMPGYVLAVTSASSLLYAQAYGYADLKLKKEVSAQTQFQIGSITKSITAIALMQLYEKGLFDPHQPVSDYLPWFDVRGEHGHQVTGHHLLTHKAGIQSGLDGYYSSPAMAFHAGQLMSHGEVGSQFHYSNIGYVVLHLLIEKLTGESYQSYVEKNILKPLGMNGSQAAITLESRARQAIGYAYPFDDRPHHPSRDLVEVGLFEYKMGDGSVLSTARDMAHYMQMLLGEGRRGEVEVISRKAFNQFTGANQKKDRKAWYQYGISTYKHGEIYRLSHGGGMVGFSSDMVVDISNDLAVFVSSNTPIAFHEGVSDYVFEVMTAVRNKTAIPPVPAVPERLNKKPLNYAGTYESKAGKQISVSGSGSELTVVDSGEHILLQYVRGHIYQSLSQGYDRYYWVFETKDDLAPIKLIYGDQVFYHERYSEPKEFKYPKHWRNYTGVYRSYSPWFPYFEIIIREGQLIAITGFGGETVFREMNLFPKDMNTFEIEHANAIEKLRFKENIHGHSVIANWSGHEFYWTGE